MALDKKEKIIFVGQLKNDEIKRGDRLKQEHTISLLFKHEILIRLFSPPGCYFFFVKCH